MQLLAIILNLPWSIPTILFAIISLPRKVQLNLQPFALVFSVRSFWWLTWAKSYRGSRAITQGSIILIGPQLLPNDLAHELIHIEQLNRRPFIHPFLYGLESLKHGHTPANKYEAEAYSRSNSTYLGNKTPTKPTPQ